MLNWLARYAPIGALILDDDGAPRSSILDVGCGPHGLACAYPDVPFTGLEVDFPHPVAPSMTGVRAAPGPLPFADGAFGTVVCLDVLEHIPRPDRRGFVAELTRVAAERVILACPSTEDAAADRYFAEYFKAQGVPVPGWLAEHDAYGLPTPAEIAAIAQGQDGFSARPIPMGNSFLATLAAVGDIFGGLSAGAAHEAANQREGWVSLFADATFGHAGRKGWLIERSALRQPLVHTAPADRAAATLAAVRCPDCGGALERVGDRMARCAGCGRVVPQDATQAWDLTAAQWAGVPTDARARVLCEPRWDLRSVAAVLSAFSGRPDPGEALLLRAAPEHIRPERALAIVRAALQHVAVRDDQELWLIHEALSPAAEDELVAACVPLG